MGALRISEPLNCICGELGLSIASLFPYCKTRSLNSTIRTVRSFTVTLSLAVSEIPMPRMAFRLRLKPATIEEYERSHRQVWPELLAKLKQVGISDYSIFRRDQDLLLVMRVEDFDSAWDQLAKDPVNLRWQAEMEKYFEPVPGLKPGERFAMMKEVFYLE